jgi:hypothetical protein
VAPNILSALIAASVALVAVYLTQFVAQRYKTFKEGSSIAAGLAGELASYRDAAPLLRVAVRTALQAVESGYQDRLRFRGIEKPVDRFFDAVVDKIGLLGPDLAEKVIYVYNNLNAFRVAFALIHEKHHEMDGDELATRIKLCDEALERAFLAGATLRDDLRARSLKSFKLFG